MEIMIVNADTNESIVREMTTEEIAEHKISTDSGKARRADALAKVENMKNALMALGLDEAIASQIAGVQLEQSLPSVVNEAKAI